MKTLAVLALVAAALVCTQPAAAKKFRITITVEPAHIWAKQPTRILVHTSRVLARNHDLRLDVVGPYYADTGNPYLEPRLRRTGPKTYTATVRFPRAGNWRLIVPNWIASGSASPPPADRTVRVRPGPSR